jgi:hypothetical protein
LKVTELRLAGWAGLGWLLVGIKGEVSKAVQMSGDPVLGLYLLNSLGPMDDHLGSQMYIVLGLLLEISPVPSSYIDVMKK